LAERVLLAVAEEDGTTADPDFPEVRILFFHPYKILE
jgi:hypothetical protein